MTEALDFSLPKHERNKVQTQSKLFLILMVAVLVVFLANIVMVLMKDGGKNKTTAGGVLSVEQQKQLALKLEKQGLNAASASAWKDYIAVALPDDEESARIWYRIGTLCQTDGRYDMALDSYYRSEIFARPEDISSEISRRTQECLEAMGKFAALRYELADRVGMGNTAADDKHRAEGDTVVAEIGTQKIMKSDLDNRIEHQIGQQLSQIAAYLPKDELNKKKEELLKQYSTDTQRQLFLNQHILEEVLYRKARESGLMDDAEVRASLKDMERSLLAGKVIEKEFANEIKITPGDLETYFEAHKKEYIQPERAKIGLILVQDKEKARIVRQRLAKGETFSVLASEMSQDQSTCQKGGELPQWIEKTEGESVPGIGESKDAIGIIFSTDKGKVAENDVENNKGIHIIKVLDREPERQKIFDEVKNEVFIAIRGRKEREVQQKLLATLKEQYNVVIHQSAFTGEDKAEKDPAQGAPK